MIELLLVGTIVLAAALYATWALMPAPARQRLARRLAGLSAASGVPAWLQRGARSLERRTIATSGHCEGCSSKAEDHEPPR